MNLTKKWKRLRRMTGSELVYRTREALQIQLHRLQLRLPDGLAHPDCSRRFHLGGGRRDFKQYLDQVAAERFYLPSTTNGREHLREFVRDRFPEWKSQAI